MKILGKWRTEQWTFGKNQGKVKWKFYEIAVLKYEKQGNDTFCEMKNKQMKIFYKMDMPEGFGISFPDELRYRKLALNLHYLQQTESSNICHI